MAVKRIRGVGDARTRRALQQLDYHNVTLDAYGVPYKSGESTGEALDDLIAGSKAVSNLVLTDAGSVVTTPPGRIVTRA